MRASRLNLRIASASRRLPGRISLVTIFRLSRRSVPSQSVPMPPDVTGTASS